MAAPALSALRYKSFSFFQGEDYSFDVWINPPQDVTGWNVSFQAIGSRVNMLFPPTVVLPADVFFYPNIPVTLQMSPALGVIPGIQPPLPTTGGCDTILLDNSALGGVSIADASVGRFTVTLARSLTNVIPTQWFSWRFYRTDAGHWTPLRWGDFDLLPFRGF